ncbi:phosphoglycolate phosphatase [Rhodovulum sp. NI22]|uniref:Phosphoglycolate phosphatase n=1 Tax=Actibacterium naphthalenivorans TaxID=1614693 RepID=A0A840CAQ8_9RHOB|nr:MULTISPECIES: phosphoglycolate phosphatase [Actibacterium]ALG90666.1 phosphoglycolate phosphatase [Actibacterium sp. EMB200-NS6]KGB81700.1 phosphoglycolate phosphatase [Rhodovulum sp. NI22]MBB4023144.1 phosphoglycolate phosphatase [Actibacterium naphthalenivorans]
MRAVIFDLDGTLIDSAPDIHAAVNRMLAEIDEEALSPETVRSFIGNGVPVLIERVMAARGLHEARHSALHELFLRHYNADPATLTTLYPNARAVLEQFAAEGIALGICTNKPEAPTRSILAAFGLDAMFAVVIGGDTLPVHKPDPAPLLAAARALGRDSTVYVGDSGVDAQTAAATGLPFALFTEGYRRQPVQELHHDASFADFADLPAIVARLAPRPAETRAP